MHITHLAYTWYQPTRQMPIPVTNAHMRAHTRTLFFILSLYIYFPLVCHLNITNWLSLQMSPRSLPLGAIHFLWFFFEKQSNPTQLSWAQLASNLTKIVSLHFLHPKQNKVTEKKLQSLLNLYLWEFFNFVFVLFENLHY